MYGWICPKCQRSNAPSVLQCPCTSGLGFDPINPYPITCGTMVEANCSRCSGTGKVRDSYHAGDMAGVFDEHDCPTCLGSGRLALRSKDG